MTLICACALVAGCNDAPTEPVSVKEATDNIHAWNGRMVRVRGWLGNCQGYDCALYPTLADAKAVATENSKSSEWRSAMKRRLNIGSAYNFDVQAAPLQFKLVTVGGILSDMCRGWFGASCFDRSPDLTPLSIEAAQPTKKAN